MTVVLDTSAVLAVLLDEPGANVVIAAMTNARLSIINLCELYTKSAAAGGDLKDVRSIIDTFEIHVQPFEERHALEVARLRPQTRRKGLGLGDRACLAEGLLSGLPVLTGDRYWAELDVGVEIRLIR